jgi:hypothetical protein
MWGPVHQNTKTNLLHLVLVSGDEVRNSFSAVIDMVQQIFAR